MVIHQIWPAVPWACPTGDATVNPESGGFSEPRGRRPTPGGSIPLFALVHDCTYVMYEFQWDPMKAKANLAKHSVDFADVVGVFFDSLAITILDLHREEERFVTIGMDFLGRVLVVVFAWRGSQIRIISARRAGRTERREYEDSL